MAQRVDTQEFFMREDRQMKQSNWTDLICYLVSGTGKNFYARILGAMEFQSVKDYPPMMGVMLKDRHYVLFNNVLWFAKASFEEVLFVLEHEAYHIILEHIPRYLDLRSQVLDEQIKAELERVRPFAVDLAVNTLLIQENRYLQSNAGFFVVPGTKMRAYGTDNELMDTPWQNFPSGKSMEWYAAELLKIQKEDPSAREFMDKILGQSGFTVEFVEGSADGEGQTTAPETGPAATNKNLLRNHKEDLKNRGDGGSLDDVENQLSLADELRSKTREVVRRAVADHKKSCGRLPGNMQERIDDLLKEPAVPWTRILRNWVVNTQRYKWRRSVSRPKRRHIGVPGLSIFPGRSKDRTYTVVWCIDTSASMGSEELELGLAELSGLQKVDKDIDIVVLEADSCLEHEYRLGSTSKISHEMHGRGGTNFNDALRRAKQLKPDIAFYFTDGYAPAPYPENRPVCPFAWVITPNGKVPDENFGKVIQTRKN
jgi:predicted metal-dependent peptidase